MANNENTRAPAGGSEPTDLHAAIMNLPCKPEAGWTNIEKLTYKIGHRDARHAAAELVASASGSISSEIESSREAKLPTASAPLPLTDDRIVDCAVSAGLHDEMWFGQDTPKGYEDCMPKLRAFARLITRMNALPQPPRTPMKTDTSREAFEAWADDYNYPGGYHREFMREAWQESRKQALEEAAKFLDNFPTIYGFHSCFTAAQKIREQIKDS